MTSKFRAVAIFETEVYATFHQETEGRSITYLHTTLLHMSSPHCSLVITTRPQKQ